MKIFLKYFFLLLMAIFVLSACSHTQTPKSPSIQAPLTQKEETSANIQAQSQTVIDENDYLDDALKDIDALEDAEIQ